MPPPKALLHAWSLKRKVPCPAYVTVQQAAQPPSFLSTVSLQLEANDKSELLNFSTSTPFNSKKAAEHAAAEVAISDLEVYASNRLCIALSSLTLYS